MLKNISKMKNGRKFTIMNLKLGFNFGMIKGFPEETVHSLYELRKTVKVKTKPVEPRDEDCCGVGCVPCIFDVYEESLKKYEAWLKTQNSEKKGKEGNSGE